MQLRICHQVQIHSIEEIDCVHLYIGVPLYYFAWRWRGEGGREVGRRGMQKKAIQISLFLNNMKSGGGKCVVCVSQPLNFMEEKEEEEEEEEEKEEKEEEEEEDDDK